MGLVYVSVYVSVCSGGMLNGMNNNEVGNKVHIRHVCFVHKKHIIICLCFGMNPLSVFIVIPGRF